MGTICLNAFCLNKGRVDLFALMVKKYEVQIFSLKLTTQDLPDGYSEN